MYRQIAEDPRAKIESDELEDAGSDQPDKDSGISSSVMLVNLFDLYDRTIGSVPVR
jgi:hypothetical protein